MTIDETIRAICYFLIFPSYVYFGLIEYNHKSYLLAAIFFLLATFFLLMLIGLSLFHYYRPIYALLQVNTAVVVALAAVTGYRSTAILAAALRGRAEDALRMIGDKHG